MPYIKPSHHSQPLLRKLHCSRQRDELGGRFTAQLFTTSRACFELPFTPPDLFDWRMKGGKATKTALHLETFTAGPFLEPSRPTHSLDCRLFTVHGSVNCLVRFVGLLAFTGLLRRAMRGIRGGFPLPIPKLKLFPRPKSTRHFSIQTYHNKSRLSHYQRHNALQHPFRLLHGRHDGDPPGGFAASQSLSISPTNQHYPQFGTIAFAVSIPGMSLNVRDGPIVTNTTTNTNTTVAAAGHPGWLRMECPSSYDFCSTKRINDGIKHLRKVSGKPREQAYSGSGPYANCGRVSCSYNSAIYWCNMVSLHLLHTYVLWTYTNTHNRIITSWSLTPTSRSRMLLPKLLSFASGATSLLAR